MIVIVEKVQVKEDEVIFLSISALAFLTNLFPLIQNHKRTHCHSVMSPLSHLSFVQREQVKFRLKKKVKIKVSHSAVAVGTVGGGEGRGQRPSA